MQDAWAATAPRVRSELLRAVHDRLLEAADEVVTLITLEMGKPLTESRAEVRYAADFLRWATSAGRCGSVTGCGAGWSGSTRAWCPTPRRRSAA